MTVSDATIDAEGLKDFFKFMWSYSCLWKNNNPVTALKMAS